MFDWFNSMSASALGVSTYVDTFVTGTSQSSLAVTIPPANNGDLMVMLVACQLYYTTTVPTGWTLSASNAAFTSNRASLYVYSRIKDGTEGSTVTWGPANSATAIAARIMVIPGGDLVMNSSSTFSVTSTSNIPTTNLGVTVPGSLFFRSISARRTSSTPASPTLGWDADMVGMAEVHSNTSFYVTLGMANKYVPSPEYEPDSTSAITPASQYASISFSVSPKVPKTLTFTQKVTLKANQTNSINVETQLLGWNSGATGTVPVNEGLLIQGNGPVTLVGTITRGTFSGTGTAIFKIDGIEIYRVAFTNSAATVAANTTLDVRDGQLLSVHTITNTAGAASQMLTSSTFQINPI